MPPPVIENPILNGPFDEPSRHFEFNDQGITDRIATGRRASGYFLPIASARKKSGQIKFDTEWTQDRFLSSPRINRIRERVKQWRQGPGITIRDRLRVLLPQDPSNYYRERDIIPSDLMERLGQARIVVTNYHGFILRERGNAAKLTKAILTKGQPSPFTESPEVMVRRVCRELGSKKQILVLNDEAHHCYRSKPAADAESGAVTPDKLTGDDRVEARKREEEARVWISGLEAIHRKLGLRAVYDLSATPFFLKGSGYAEGTLFPWVVSDFSLIDAIESGIVKIPRVPVEDNSMTGDQPTYRDLWPRIREDLPKKGRKADAGGEEPNLPVELEGAIRSLYQGFIDTNYDGESFFVRHAYFTGADEPYEKLKRALRTEIDEAAWSTLYSTVSRPFAQPETGKIAVKVINHYGDEVLKVFALSEPM